MVFDRGKKKRCARGLAWSSIEETGEGMGLHSAVSMLIPILFSLFVLTEINGVLGVCLGLIFHRKEAKGEERLVQLMGKK